MQENMMTVSNLAICVGPSILWSNDNSVMMDTNYSKNVSNVTQILIEEHGVIYSDDAPYVFVEEASASDEKTPASAAEDDVGSGGGSSGAEASLRKSSAISNRSSGSKSE